MAFANLKWLNVRQMAGQQRTDRDLMEQFERGTLPGECLGHREHVRVAFLYLTQYPVLEALQAFSKALQRFAAARGKPQLYHETITWAYIFLIRERMARSGTVQGWEEFARNNADLLTWKNGVLDRYYREATLTSDLARAIFILPDRCARAWLGHELGPQSQQTHAHHCLAVDLTNKHHLTKTVT